MYFGNGNDIKKKASKTSIRWCTHTNAANGGDQLIFYLNTCKEELLPFSAPHFPKEETNQSQSTIIQESSASQLFFRKVEVAYLTNIGKEVDVTTRIYKSILDYAEKTQTCQPSTS